ncbi:MAG TPA: hypothetical protein VHM20_00615, partial [Gammaproteobacteria bacterium]|nr:hypothetical protein [Gammaproteobacteria bacterium]
MFTYDYYEEQDDDKEQEQKKQKPLMLKALKEYLNRYEETSFSSYYLNKFMREIEKLLNSKSLSLTDIKNLLSLLDEVEVKQGKDTFKITKKRLDEYPKPIMQRLTHQVEVLLNSEVERNKADFRKNHIEILWLFQKLKYDCQNLRKLRKVLVPLLEEKFDLAHLHLCCQLQFSAYRIKQTTFDPLPSVIKELRFPKNTPDSALGCKKLLRSIALLGFHKDDMKKIERVRFFNALPNILKSVENQKDELSYIIKIFWALARLDFNYEELKDTLIFQMLIAGYKKYQDEMVNVEDFSITVWSMAAINLPVDHTFYQQVMQKALPFFQNAPIAIEDNASQILLSHIAYGFPLTLARKQYLEGKLTQLPESSQGQKDIEELLRDLLNSERKKDLTIPQPPVPMSEVKFGNGCIRADIALSRTFVVEYDGELHEDKHVSDKFKDRLYEKLGIMCIRIPSRQAKENKDNLKEYLKAKVMEPYLAHHKATLEKMAAEKKSETPTKKHSPKLPKNTLSHKDAEEFVHNYLLKQLNGQTSEDFDDVKKQILDLFRKIPVSAKALENALEDSLVISSRIEGHKMFKDTV